MATRKDYASKKRGGKTATRSGGTKQAPRRKAPVKKPFPVKLLLVTVLMCGALGYLIFSLLQVNPHPKQETVTIATPKPQKPELARKPAKASAQQAETETDKRFEFYRILPKSEITTSDPTAYKSTPRDAKSEQLYVLQAGSFRNPNDADRMRAQLILLGLPNVSSQKTRNNKGETWYRVRTGPFDNRTTLKKAHDKLTKQNIFPLKVKAN